MAEILAKLRWIWIENGDKVAAVMIVVAFAVLLLALMSRKGGGNDAE